MMMSGASSREAAHMGGTCVISESLSISSGGSSLQGTEDNINAAPELTPPDIEANEFELKEDPSNSTMEPTDSREAKEEASFSPANANTNARGSRRCTWRRWSHSAILNRMRHRFQLEKELFLRSWKLFLFCAFFQYIHSAATNLVYYLHDSQSAEPLRDLGFELLSPPLQDDDQFISEITFFVLVAIIVSFVLYPFFFAKENEREQPFVVVMATRYARVLIMAQTLRIVSFLVTILPSPNYHCRADAEDYDPPASIAEVFLRFDAFKGCGDLIFSSHTIFVTLGGLLVNHYSKNRYLKAVVWALVVVLGFLVVAARKHYTVDIIVGWYTCPLLWFYCDKTFQDDVPRSTRDAQATGSSSNRNVMDVVA